LVLTVGSTNLRFSFPGANRHPRLEPFDRLGLAHIELVATAEQAACDTRWALS
jgi:hypothetical protein